MTIFVTKGRAVCKQKDMEATSLDEAMVLTGFGAFNIQTMLLAGLVLMGMIMQTIMLSYVIPAAQCDLGLTQRQKGVLGAVPYIAIILTSHLWGWVADTRGRRYTLLVSMGSSLVFTTLSSLAPDLYSFGVLQFLASCFISGTAGVAYAYVGEMNSPQYRDKMVTCGASFVGIGTVMLSAVSWLILPLDFHLEIPLLGIDYRPWRLLVVACAVPFMVSMVLMLWAPETPKFLNSSRQYDECLALLKKMYRINKKLSEDSYPVKSLEQDPEPPAASSRHPLVAMLLSMRDQTVPLFKPPLLKWTSLACFVQMGILATANGFYIWFPTILNSLASHQGSGTMCDIIYAVKHAAVASNGTVPACDDTVIASTFERAIWAGLVFCSTYLIVGLIVDWTGKKSILVVILGVAGACGMTSHLVRSQQLAVGLFAVFQMSGACIGLVTAVVVDLIPTKLRAMAVCLSLMAGRVGSVLGSNLVGLLLDTRCGVSFYLFGGLLVVCSLLCLTIPSKTSSSKSSDKMADNKMADNKMADSKMADQEAAAEPV